MDRPIFSDVMGQGRQLLGCVGASLRLFSDLERRRIVLVMYDSQGRPTIKQLDRASVKYLFKASYMRLLLYVERTLYKIS